MNGRERSNAKYEDSAFEIDPNAVVLRVRADISFAGYSLKRQTVNNLRQYFTKNAERGIGGGLNVSDSNPL